MAREASNNVSPDCETDGTCYDMEIDIGEPEIAQCLKIMKMTDEEIKENPVLYNPFIHVPLPMINWTSKGLVSPCCMDHYEALPYGECKSHPKIQFCDTKSLIAFTIHKDLNVLGVTMFHDFTWRDKSFENHLNNTAIFETFPINVAAFYEGKMIPDYSIIKKPIPTSFNQIDWLFPRNYHSMYYGNWDMKESLQKIIPIIENWNNVKSYVKTTLHHQSLLTQTANKLSASNKKIEQLEAKEDKWWNDYVDTSFHSQFAKNCKGKYKHTYKIQIAGIPFSSLAKNILIFNGLVYNGKKLNFEIVHGVKVTVNNDKYFVDWLIDHAFNNGEQYIFTDKNKRDWSHYDDKFKWEYAKSQTLTLQGNLKKRANDQSPWTYFE